MKIGIMQGRLLKPESKLIQSFPKKNWAKEFEIAKSNRIKIIEWIVDRKDFQKNPINTSTGRSKIKKLKKRYNININSLTAELFLQKPFTDSNNDQEYEFNILKKVLKNSAKLNIKYFIIPILERASLKEEDEEFFKKKLIDLTKFLKKNKQIILFETDISVNRVEKLLSDLPKKYFGINFDTGNSVNSFYSFNDIRRLLKYTHNIHLKDKNKKFLTVKLGNGLFDFKKFFFLLKKIKYKKNLILQTARSTNNHVNDINLNKKYIEGFIKN